MTRNSKKQTYDLEERTAKFAEKIITFCKKAPKTVITIPIIRQLIKSGTSMGANYQEANGASSKRDFRHKIFICKRDSKETKYWLRLLSVAVDKKDFTADCNTLTEECQEFILIFSKIASSSK